MNISSTFLSSLLGGFGVALLLHPPKSDDKNVEEMFTKCSTAQSFIRTEMTTYRISTLDIFIFFVQKPGLWTTAELGSGTWMSEGDKEKLRMMYECDGSKFFRSYLINTISV